MKPMTKNNLQKYIKDKTGQKTECVTRSVSITKEQQDFVNEKNLNLSKIVRDKIDELKKGK